MQAAETLAEAPPGRLVGYARVSTSEQTIDMQIAALERAGVQREDIYHDRGVSGAKTKRPGLEMALRAAGAGDTIVVWKLDRFGRNTLDVLQRLDTLHKRGVKFRSLTEGFDTSTPIGMAVAGILSIVAQLERDFGRARTRAGMEAARAKGKVFGPPRKLDIEGAKKMFREGKTIAEVAKRYDVSRSAVYQQFTYAEIQKLWAAGEKPRKK